MQAELVLDCRNQHGECAQWNALDQRVWWTDIEGRRLWWYAPAEGEAGHIEMPDRVCCFAPRKDGGFILGYANRLALTDAAGREVNNLTRFEPDNPNTRLNDGRTDRQGRLVAGGMNEGTGAADSSVIRVDPDGRVETLIEGVACANSICFSADGRTLYFADTPQKTIHSYTYDAGTVGAARLYADFANEPGLPDGSCVDAQGGVWNAEWEGRRVVRVAPNGAIDAVVEVPVWKPTCCAFGGANLDTLYITTSRLASSVADLDSEPTSGGLFAIKPGARGLEDVPFAG